MMDSIEKFREVEISTHHSVSFLEVFFWLQQWRGMGAPVRTESVTASGGKVRFKDRLPYLRARPVEPIDQPRSEFPSLSAHLLASGSISSGFSPGRNVPWRSAAC